MNFHLSCMTTLSVSFQTLPQDVIHHRGRHSREPETETAERAAKPGKHTHTHTPGLRCVYDAGALPSSLTCFDDDDAMSCSSGWFFLLNDARQPPCFPHSSDSHWCTLTAIKKNVCKSQMQCINRQTSITFSSFRLQEAELCTWAFSSLCRAKGEETWS